MSMWMRGLMVSVLTSALASAADPALLRLVMPEAKTLAGINVAQAKASPFGQFLLSEAQTQDAELQKLIEAAGFDPRRDLHEILIASTGGPKKGEGLLLVRGVFDPLRLSMLAQLEGGATIQHYKGVEILAGKEPGNGKPATWLGFLDSTTAVLGDAGSVQGAIDRRDSGSRLSTTLAARAQELSGLYDIWALSLAPVSEWASQVPGEQAAAGVMKNDVFSGLRETALGIRFGPDIEVALEALARSDKDATALVDVVRFLTGMMQMNQKDPKAASLAPILQSLDLRAEGSKVKLALRIPETELEKFILSARENRRTGTATGTGAAPRRQAPKAPQPGASGLTIHSSEGSVVIKNPR